MFAKVQKPAKAASASFSSLVYKVFSNPKYTFAFFLVFLTIRNWPVFLLSDMYDGMSFKMRIVSDGISISSFREYASEFVLKSFNQHFIPLWFLFFYGLSVVTDNQPWVLGLLSFAAVALLLFFMFRILLSFSIPSKKKVAVALFVTLLFSSTIFFLEIIAWKWMLSLLISSTAFYGAVFIVLQKKHSTKLKLAYFLTLLVSTWTFGLGWIWVWGLVVFFLLNKSTKSPLFPITLTVALVGTALVGFTSLSSANDTNIFSIVLAIPSATVMITANILLNLSGVFRFTNLSHNYISTVLGVTILITLGFYYFRRHRSNLFDTKDALVCALLVTYVASIALSLTRVIPASGLMSSTDLASYVFGNRYLFTYAVPLALAIGLIGLPYLAKLTEFSLAVLIFAALILGFILQANYPKIEPVITNQARNDFYRLTPTALNEANRAHLVLPNTSSDLLFKGGIVELSDAIYIRKSAFDAEPAFKPTHTLTPEECAAIKNNETVRRWLNIYNDQWCVGY